MISATTSGMPSAWNDAFTLGYQPMDNVHLEFLALIEALARSETSNMAEVLDRLVRHTVEHFETEERWMRETAFPARECHIDEHAAVMRSMDGVRHRLQQGELQPAWNLARALADWFPVHATHLDSALAHWLCKRQMGGASIVLRRSPTHATVLKAKSDKYPETTP